MTWKEGILQPVRKVFSSTMDVVLFLFISLLIFSLLILVPVWTTPGNDFFFQLSLLEPQVLMLFILLSAANAFLIMSQLYIRRAVTAKFGRKGRVKQSMTAFGILTSSLAATFACAACYSSVLALFGLGSTVFLVRYQMWIALAAILLTFYAIYQSGKRINNNCQVCTI